MTRIRGSLAALAAVGLLVVGCGPEAAAPAAGGTGPKGTAAATRAGDEGTGSPARPGGGGRWCEAVKAFVTAMDPLFVADAAVEKADVQRARARLTDLKAAAPAEIKSQVMDISEFYAAVIDIAGKSMPEDTAGYARLAKTKEKLEVAMPAVADYTQKHCPGLAMQLPGATS